MRFRSYLFGGTALILLFALGLFIGYRLRGNTASPEVSQTAAAVPPQNASSQNSNSTEPTRIYAHNLMLRKGPDFRFYVRWLRGEINRTNLKTNPSFDDPDSFIINIQTGVLRANIGDLTHFLNASGLKSSPLKNIALSGNGNQLKLKATLHKVIPLPVELDGTISPVAGNQIQLHVSKINVLKIPFKALLGGLHISLGDLFQPKGVPGIRVVENDVFFDTQALLPPPHIRGQLTAVRIVNPDLEEVFGNAQGDVDRVEQWRNFLRLAGGSLDFGKLTMHHVDLIMIDVSKDAWFDLDLTNYQAQLVNGYTRMTPQAGLQVFMPDLRDLPKSKTAQDVSVQWMKNRNQAPPADVIPQK